MSKYLRISVAKRLFTDLYVEVDDKFDTDDAKGFASVRQLPLLKIANETTRKEHWEEECPLIDSHLEIHGVDVVSEKEAKQFIYWDNIESKKVPWPRSPTT